MSEGHNITIKSVLTEMKHQQEIKGCRRLDQSGSITDPSTQIMEKIHVLHFEIKE